MRARAPRRRASRASCAGPSGASVATTAMQLPASRDRDAGGPGSTRPAGTPSTRRSGADPKFASTSTPTVAPAAGAIRLAVPIPPFQSKQTIPVPAPTAPSATGPSARRGERAARVPRLDLDRPAVAEPAVVALPHHRDDDVLRAHGGVGGDGRGDRTVEHAPDRHRGRQVDRRLDHAPLGQAHEAGQLARAVEHRAARGHGRGEQPVRRPGRDRGHAGPGDPAAARLVAPDRHVPHPHAADVGDRVRRAGVEGADAQPELAQAGTAWVGRAGHARKTKGPTSLGCRLADR